MPPTGTHPAQPSPNQEGVPKGRERDGGRRGAAAGKERKRKTERKQKASSRRASVLPSVKLQPAVLHIAPEALQTPQPPTWPRGQPGREGGSQAATASPGLAWLGLVWLGSLAGSGPGPCLPLKSQQPHQGCFLQQKEGHRTVDQGQLLFPTPAQE